MSLFGYFERAFAWLQERLNRKQFLVLSSILVGLTAGLAAVLLKTLVHFIHTALTRDHGIPFQNYLYLLFPLAGLFLTVFITMKLFGGRLGRGTANILRSVIKKSAFLPRDQMYSHVITSAVTVGFGGSAGLESPIVTTGSAIGSNYARRYHLAYKDRVLLLACGAAAGISGAFNAPIAGVLFAMEVLLVDAAISAFIPLMLSAAVGALCSRIILSEGILLSFSKQEAFNYHNIPWYIVLGLLAGFVSVYYARAFMKVEGRVRSGIRNRYVRSLTGGVILAGLIYLFPALSGEGYGSIISLAEADPGKLFGGSPLSSFSDSSWFVLAFIGAIMLLKVIAAALTIGSGGNGGNFAPSLFVGAFLGFFFSRLLNMTGLAKLPESNFTIVAMAGILTGIFHAPLTGIFLIAEVTGGYDLIIPLMMVSAISYLVVKYFEPLSMDALALARKGDVMIQDRDKAILSSIRTAKIIETDFQSVSPDSTLRELVNIIAHSHRNIFPAVDTAGKLAGVILLDDIRELMFKTEKYDSVKVSQLMHKPPDIISPDDSMHTVMKKFDETGAWNLPVVEEGKYLGFISKSSLLSRYRKHLIRSA